MDDTEGMNTQIQIDGDSARAVVRRLWPAATSTYTGAFTAQVYDQETGAVLGEADAREYVVEHAWIAAAKAVTTRD
jgi:hypothetical protein